MNSKFAVVFLLCVMLAVCIDCEYIRGYDSGEELEAIHMLKHLLRKRGCTDIESETYCQRVVSGDNCGIATYRMNCRKSCGNC